MFYHALTGGNTPTEDLSPVLLWENSSPTADFNAQTISLDLTDYAGVIVEFRKTTSSTKINTRLYAKKNEDVDEIFGAGSYYTKGDSNTARGVNVTDAGVTFAEGYGNMTLNNKTTIPIRIYGVKEYVVESSKQYTSLEVINITKKAGGDTSANLDITCNIDDLLLLYLTPQGPGDNTYNITINGANLLDEYNTDINSGSGIYHRKTCLYKATSENVQGSIAATITSIMTGFKIS